MKIPQSPQTKLWFETMWTDNPEAIQRLNTATSTLTEDGRYLHWDELRRLPAPSGLSHQEWWVAVWLARQHFRKETPLQDKGGKNFTYSLAEPIPRRLHEIDMSIGGKLGVYDQVRQPDVRDRYYINTLIEEAITSSQLEGATTTPQVAKELLRDQRSPKDLSERMIVNNYLTMKRLKELKDRELSTELVFEIHKQVTEGTLDTADAAGRFRRAHEVVHVFGDKGEIYHSPPPADELEHRMKLMCEFANRPDEQDFVHPVISSIILHFWLGYDHPFIDGNGRTARALFYWSMLRNGYWSFEYTSISQILLQAPAKYTRAYLHTKTDDGDLTYFILHQLEVIHRAGQELHNFVRKKSQEKENLQTQLRDMHFLNYRQRNLIGSALKTPHKIYTIQAHKHTEAISYQTARTDLLNLDERGLFVKRQSGKKLEFSSVANLEKKLKLLATDE